MWLKKWGTVITKGIDLCFILCCVVVFMVFGGAAGGAGRFYANSKYKILFPKSFQIFFRKSIFLNKLTLYSN